VSPSLAGSPGAPLALDLLRADLYRLLDALARARADRHGDLVREFERAWEEYRLVTAGRP
jgi:hypothetical protein